MNQTNNSSQTLSDRDSGIVFWGWGLATGLGTALGALVAVLLVPEAGFAKIVPGEYGIHLLEFALAIGVVLGITQYLALCRLMSFTGRTTNYWLALWIPIAAIGVVIMMGPLWMFAAIHLMKKPWVAVSVMLPGMAVIGTGQWLVLTQYGLAGPKWIGRTILGALIGTFVGLIFVSLSAVTWGDFPGSAELIWAGSTGFGIGFLQGDYLSKAIGGHGAPSQLTAGCGALLLVLLCLFFLLILPAMYWAWH